MNNKLIDMFSTGATVILFEMNKAMSKQLFNELPTPLKKDKEEVVKILISRFQEAGYGKIELVEFNSEEEKSELRVYNNFYSERCREKLALGAIVEGILFWIL